MKKIILIVGLLIILLSNILIVRIVNIETLKDFMMASFLVALWNLTIGNFIFSFTIKY